MLKQILIIAYFISSLTVVAKASTDSQFEIPHEDHAKIEAEIIKTIKKTTGNKILKNFKVAWDSTQQCLKVDSEMNSDIQMGVCIVSAQGFQVESQVAVIKTVNGYSISLIYVDVE